MRVATWLVAAAALVNVCVALFYLPYSPGFDDRTLYTAIYAYTHYGRLFYPVYDMPLMYMHPPTKYWLIAELVSSGIPLRLAAAGIVIFGFSVAVAGIFACRVTAFQRMALLFALSTTITLCPFVSTRPENLAHGEVIGRLRPEDMMLLFWFAGLVWLEASRRAQWPAFYSGIGAACLALSAVSHYPAIPAALGLLVYGTAAFVARPEQRWRRTLPIAASAALVILPVVIALQPYWRTVLAMILLQNGETSDRGLAATWARHLNDFWLLVEWMKIHAGNTWAALALLSVPVRVGVPPLVIASAILFAFRSTRLLMLAAIWMPAAVVFAAHKWIGYELPEVALFLLACGWMAAALLDRLQRPALRVAAGAGLALSLLAASPLVADVSALVFMDESHSPERLRAMGRAVIGPGASLHGAFYTSGEDRWVLYARPGDPRVDVIAEHEFHLSAAEVHDRYFERAIRLAGFVLTPEMPSASTVYFSASPDRAAWSGYVNTHAGIRRFSPDLTGWRFVTLDCPAAASEMPWVTPAPSTPIAGYIPRTDYCVNTTLASHGLAGRYASAFFRRTFPNGTSEPRALVPFVIERQAESAAGVDVAARCGCRTVEEVFGGMTDVDPNALLAALRASDRVVEFYTSADDLAAGRTMAERFSGRPE